MKVIVCKNCGANIFKREADYWYCEYCESKFPLTKEDFDQLPVSFSGKTTLSNSTQISLSDDVEKLLQKCKTDRKNARKYANLILDIDPDNTDALKYL